MPHRSTRTDPPQTQPQTEAKKESSSPLAELSTPRGSSIKVYSPLLHIHIKYIDNPAFSEPDAATHILKTPLPNLKMAGRPCASTQSVEVTTLLTRDEERHLFLKMNLLKCLACSEIQALERGATAEPKVDQIQRLLKDAQEVKDFIVLANKRLVYKEAALVDARSLDRDDLVSEGFINLILSSVESFDCSRGIKFSTYAVTSLKRHYLRVRERNRNWERGLEIHKPNTDTRVDHRPAISQDLRNQAALADIAGKVLNLLPARDAHAMRLRFLESRQFKSVGEELGVSTQRAEQIIKQAIKLARSLCPTSPLDDLL